MIPGQCQLLWGATDNRRLRWRWDARVGVAANGPPTPFLTRWNHALAANHSGCVLRKHRFGRFDFEASRAIYQTKPVWGLSSFRWCREVARPVFLEYMDQYAVRDIDNDNHAEIVVPNNNVSNFGTRRASPYSKMPMTIGVWATHWNQHAYSITNVNDDGPSPPTQLPTGPPTNFQQVTLQQPQSSQADKIIDILTFAVMSEQRLTVGFTHR